jgi:hypothetical protein
MTATAVSIFLGIHNNTVKKIPASELPYFRVGARGDRRYLPSDVDAYIDRHMVRS